MSMAPDGSCTVLPRRSGTENRGRGSRDLRRVKPPRERHRGRAKEVRDLVATRRAEANRLGLAAHRKLEAHFAQLGSLDAERRNVRPAVPNEIFFPPNSFARRLSRSSSELKTSVPSGARPSTISHFASAISSIDEKFCR